MPDKDHILQKIRAVLARADAARTGSVEEAATAAAIAAKMMAEHQIDQAELLFDEDAEDAKAAEREDPMTRQDILNGETKTAVRWQVSLAGGIARANGCKCVYRSGGYKYNGTRAKIFILGRESAVATCRYMFAYLVPEIQRICKIEKDRLGISGSGTKKWGNSFRHGAVETINIRLARARREAMPKLEGGTSTALVALDKEHDRLQDFVTSVYPKLGTDHSKREFDSHGYSQGRKRGNDITLPGGQRRLNN